MRAALFGRNLSSDIAASTLSRVSGLIRGESFNTRDTVWRETPAAAATSRTPGARDSEFSITAPS
jgi:hypothetical protein